MNDISIDLDTAEALMALGAIQDKALDASKLAATSTGDVHEIADLSAKIIQRIERRIVDALYPAEAMRREDTADEIEFGLV